jgi:anaerobic selenocysteine-containing dehydrogenase
MSKTKPDANSDTNVNRRGFLKGLGTGAAGAATVAAGVGVAAPAEAAESAADKKKARYKESEHVKKYYATNRYL